MESWLVNIENLLGLSQKGSEYYDEEILIAAVKLHAYRNPHVLLLDHCFRSL